MAQSILDIFVAKQRIDVESTVGIRQAAKEQRRSIEELLSEQGFTEQEIAEAKSELYHLPIKSLEATRIPGEALQDISEDSAKFYRMLPLGRKGGHIEIGVLHPDNPETQEAIKFVSGRLGLPVRLFIITPSDLNRGVREYRGLSQEVTRAVGEFQKEYRALAEQIRLPVTHTEQAIEISEEAPVTKIVTVILRHAVEGGASDIHIEPMRDHIRVRFRLDGILYTSLLLPAGIQGALASKIKIMANLKIDETRIPQDGRFHAEILNRGIDFRVSTFPTGFKEKVVIRILDPSTHFGTLKDLGISGRNLEVIEKELKRPYGLILITGPTGSGKSTTLYALLQLLNQERTNIVSLEDPIEYYIPGVNQSQVMPEIGYDFATGLRHIVRQDPDIIMVGEIRDKETAALAIHAALTGHLVLSTLHTNNALGVIPRLIDMGVDPFLIPPTLILAIAQRLARKLCPDSRTPIPAEGAVKELLTKEAETFPSSLKTSLQEKISSQIYQSQISPTCPKGTRGRIGLFEVLSMTPELEQIILSGTSEGKLAQEAKRQEMITMRQDGIIKVLEGVIGLEELLEVT